MNHEINYQLINSWGVAVTKLDNREDGQGWTYSSLIEGFSMDINVVEPLLKHCGIFYISTKGICKQIFLEKPTKKIVWLSLTQYILLEGKCWTLSCEVLANLEFRIL